jgi:CRP/FNR family transcriptional regulator, cyclic AMP receptor protein
MRIPMLLKSYSLSQLLSENDKQALMALGKSLEFRERKCLFRHGDMGKCLYIIRRGDVNISVTSNDGREIILNKLSDGEIFGEIAMFDGGARTADAWVQKGSTLISIDREDFLNFLNKRSHLNAAVILLLCKRLRSCSELLEDFLFNDALKRLVCKLISISEKHNNLVNSLIEITQEDLAKMTGSSREVVNRNLQLLQDKGLLFLQRKRIIIPDIAKLKKISGVGSNGPAVSFVAPDPGRKGKRIG